MGGRVAESPRRRLGGKRSSSASRVITGFDDFYRRYWRDVHSMCNRYVQDPHRAEDLAQEVFVRALKHFESLDLDRSAWPWLSTIVRSVCVDEIRVAQNRAVVALESIAGRRDPRRPDDTWDEVAIREKRRRLSVHLHAALRRLTQGERRIFLAKAVDGSTWPEVARAEGRTEASVRNTAFRARRVLRLQLAEARREAQWFGAAGLWLHIRQAIHRARNRWQQRAVSFSNIFPAIGEQLASALACSVFMTVTLIAPVSAAATAYRIASPSAGLKASQSRQSNAQAPSSLHDSPTRTGSISIVKTSLRTSATRQHSVAPASGELIVDIRGPGGQTIFHSERDYSCDRQGADLLPQRGPVRSVC